MSSTVTNPGPTGEDPAPEEAILKRDPETQRSIINKTVYLQLHRPSSSSSNRHSVDNLKFRFENITRQQSQSDTNNEEVVKRKYTPADFGYPKNAKLSAPLIRSRSKDENSNLVSDSDVEERPVVVQRSESEESVHKIAEELSVFTMDGKPKERKRSNSFRKLFSGGIFGKDKKKKEEEKNKVKNGETRVYNDNMRNESNFVRQTPQRHTISNQPVRASQMTQEIHEGKIKELEREYAEMHVNRFNEIRHSFTEPTRPDYLPMDNPRPKPSISDYISAPVNKYIDTSSSASAESENINGSVVRDTPPRAQETLPNFKMTNPKSPTFYQNDKASPRTIERNLNRSNSKDYPDKATLNGTYGTVFDSLECAPNRSGDFKAMNSKPPPIAQKPLLLPLSPASPKSPSLESSKLKLPPNREIYEPQPRVKSPIPSNRVSADKIIATELLRNSRSPTPPKKIVRNFDIDPNRMRPPVFPKPIQRKPSDSSLNQSSDMIVTNAQVHVPRRATTPMDNYSNLPGVRASTPVELRRHAALKLSPQKEDIRKSVEEYYWKELKKMKEEEDYKLYAMQMASAYDEENARVRRSRSLSPSHQKLGRRSLSLPRDGRSQVDNVYGRLPPQQPIPEERTLVLDSPAKRQLVYDQQQQEFVRNNPERRSFDSLQRPIFRRGSLTRQEIYENQPYNKKVSFSSQQAPQQVWPTKNGYTQSPPQRRLEKRESDLDDEVFLPNTPIEPIYGQRLPQNQPYYANRPPVTYEAMRLQQIESNYGQRMTPMGPRRPSMDSITRSRQDIYYNQRVPPNLAPPPPPLRRDILIEDDIYGRHGNYRYPVALQRNPVYSSRQSITDSNYGQRHVSVNNKYCDMYGQIHDAPSSGVLMGQLQSSPMMIQRAPYVPQANFVRGSRLTASANDIGRRVPISNGSDVPHQQTNYDNRPLPPPPPGKKSGRYPPISDTESGSDASEIQRIMQIKTKNKKRGLFGK